MGRATRVLVESTYGQRRTKTEWVSEYVRMCTRARLAGCVNVWMSGVWIHESH